VGLAELTGETSAAIGQFLLGKARMSVEVYNIVSDEAGVTPSRIMGDWSRLHDEWLKRRRENYKFKTKTKTEKRTQGQNT
jgi:hypothetical protein